MDALAGAEVDAPAFDLQTRSQALLDQLGMLGQHRDLCDHFFCALDTIEAITFEAISKAG